MAYDFNNIAYIKRANGTEIKQIKKGSTTLWTKPYVWEQYNVSTTTQEVTKWEAQEDYEWEDEEIDFNKQWEDWIEAYYYQSYTIDSNGYFNGINGRYISNPQNLASYYKTYPYYIANDRKVMAKFTRISPQKWGSQGNGKEAWVAICDLIEYKAKQIKVTETIAQKGTYIQNIPDSTNKYPEDGVSGSYWYTLISSPNTPGFSSSSAGYYSVEDVSGSTYGFVLNSNGYYESTNNGIHNSYSICKVNININKTASLYVDCINYAESGYDFGILSNLNTSLSLDYSADTTNVKKSFKGSSSSTIQTVSYDSLSAGSYYIYIKFIKDVSQSSNNDSLQFKIRIE